MQSLEDGFVGGEAPLSEGFGEAKKMKSLEDGSVSRKAPLSVPQGRDGDAPWKILSSEYLTDKPFFTARKDKCITSEGKIIPEYYVVELDPTLCALAITEDNFVVMVKQYRHSVEKTMLEIPGGFADKGEDPEKAIARELLEETGYEFSKYELVGEVAANPGVLNNYTKLYLATGGKKVAEQKLDGNEEIKVELIPLEDVVQMVLQNKIEQSLHVNCIFYALLKMGRLKVR